MMNAIPIDYLNAPAKMTVEEASTLVPVLKSLIQGLNLQAELQMKQGDEMGCYVYTHASVSLSRIHNDMLDRMSEAEKPLGTVEVTMSVLEAGIMSMLNRVPSTKQSVGDLVNRLYDQVASTIEARQTNWKG